MNWKILKINKWNLPISILYIIFSWLPIFKIPAFCSQFPCPQGSNWPLVLFVDRFLEGALWI